jgi:hypothetical protein
MLLGEQVRFSSVVIGCYYLLFLLVLVLGGPFIFMSNKHLGDIAFRFLDRVRSEAKYSSNYSAHVTVADINPDMLRVGQERAKKLGYFDCTATAF